MMNCIIIPKNNPQIIRIMKKDCIKITALKLTKIDNFKQSLTINSFKCMKIKKTTDRRGKF